MRELCARHARVGSKKVYSVEVIGRGGVVLGAARPKSLVLGFSPLYRFYRPLQKFSNPKRSREKIKIKKQNPQRPQVARFTPDLRISSVL